MRVFIVAKMSKSDLQHLLYLRGIYSCLLITKILLLYINFLRSSCGGSQIELYKLENIFIMGGKIERKKQQHDLGGIEILQCWPLVSLTGKGELSVSIAEKTPPSLEHGALIPGKLVCMIWTQNSLLRFQRGVPNPDNKQKGTSLAYHLIRFCCLRDSHKLVQTQQVSVIICILHKKQNTHPGMKGRHFGYVVLVFDTSVSVP